MRNSRADGKHLLDSFSCVPAFLIQPPRIGRQELKSVGELFGTQKRAFLQLLSCQFDSQVP
jgi:hypothetical protein